MLGSARPNDPPTNALKNLELLGRLASFQLALVIEIPSPLDPNGITAIIDELQLDTTGRAAICKRVSVCRILCNRGLGYR
ncbi:hypothetical protein [Xanthomonas phaseoli]|uniref:hypothetical protein n=1 Tax=Xanthomonas phaseoli TaxID=1985254 RepID=UPI001EF068FD|nr:hypothetical protein [Xanthomonas phaseoli]